LVQPGHAFVLDPSRPWAARLAHHLEYAEQRRRGTFLQGRVEEANAVEVIGGRGLRHIQRTNALMIITAPPTATMASSSAVCRCTGRRSTRALARNAPGNATQPISSATATTCAVTAPASPITARRGSTRLRNAAVRLELVNSADSERIGTTGSGPTIGTSTSGKSAPVP